MKYKKVYTIKVKNLLINTSNNNSGCTLHSALCLLINKKYYNHKNMSNTYIISTLICSNKSLR